MPGPASQSPASQHPGSQPFAPQPSAPQPSAPQQSAPQSGRPPSSHQELSIDVVLGLTAAGSVAAAILLSDGARATSLSIAGVATGALLMRSWCRAFMRKAIARATDASEREREDALSNAAQHAETWRAIVDTATEGIMTIDARGRIKTVNGAAEKLFGYQKAEIIGLNVKLLMPEPYHSEHDGYLERYLRTGERRIIGIGREVIGSRKDGSQFPIDLSVGEGLIEGRKFFTAVIHDLSERRELQTKLAQTERLAAVGELAAGVAHEINNPINTMINCAQLIQDGDEPGANTHIIIEEGGRIADIVRALLQFARDDRDEAQPTSLAEVVQRTMRLIGESWKRHGITLTIDIKEDLPLVFARPQKVQQVLLNLMINAKDALILHDIENRHVSLTAQVAGQGVEFTVADNGPGIADTIRDRIFEPFITTKRSRGGTGLGLSISRSIIEGYGGHIRLSAAAGGAVFTTWLPLAPAE